MEKFNMIEIKFYYYLEYYSELYFNNKYFTFY